MTFFNAYSVPKIVPAITQVKSPIIRVYEILSYLYPIQLALGLCAALILLLREPARPALSSSAGFFADLATAPLYSNYMIPRYILAGIFISYLLIRPGRSKPDAAAHQKERSTRAVAGGSNCQISQMLRFHAAR